jgi:chemotaxis protein CheD
VLGEDLGDVYPRRVVYFPQTGRIRVRKLSAGRDETLAARERQYLQQLDSKPDEGEVELF